MHRVSVLSLIALTAGLVIQTESFLLGGSCRNRCGKALQSTDGETCQCNDHCVKYGDCCPDYQLLCLGSSSSCHGRCGDLVSSDHSCQCNSHCLRFSDCCNDYNDLCVDSTPTPTSGTCKTFSKMGQALWDNDVNRLSSSDVTTNVQTHVTDGTSTDKSASKLFTKVTASKLSLKTYAAFLNLLNNFYPQQTSSEHVTSHETSEVKTFLDAILDTKVMAELLNFLVCQSKVTSKSDLKSTLQKIWFDFYKRSYKYASRSSSGFEHVMVGEYKDSATVSGFHSWLSFYQKEKSGNINYLGYVSKKSNPDVIGAAFTWGSHLKTKGSFFVRVSPEFDMAIYTLCYLMHAGEVCPLTINGHAISIKTYDDGEGHLATAFIM